MKWSWLQDRPGRQFLLFAAVSFLTRGVSLFVNILDIDEASYAVAAQVLLRGGTLYVDVADHHPPLAYVYYAAVQALFGPDMLWVRIATLGLVVPGTALALSAYFEHRARGVVAALLYLFFGASFLAHDMWAVNTEVLYLLPATWALVLVRPSSSYTIGWRPLVSGQLLGVAVLVKYLGRHVVVRPRRRVVDG